MKALQAKFMLAGAKYFNYIWARMRCVPHTIHLSVLEVSQSHFLNGVRVLIPSLYFLSS